MGRTRRRDAAKERVWREHIEAQKRSGLSVREYCSEHRLPTSQFYWWRREIRLRDEAGRKRAADRVPSASFAQMVLRPSPVDIDGPSGVTAVAPCGMRLEVARGFDEETLRRAARALLEAGRC